MQNLLPYYGPPKSEYLHVECRNVLKQSFQVIPGLLKSEKQNLLM